MDKIPVLYLSSEAFSKKMAVSIASLLDNKKPTTYYDIYVLVEKIYSKDGLYPFEKLKQEYSDFEIHWVEMDDAFNDTQVNVVGVGKETMYRLMAPEVLPQVERCIYLDADTLILDDLSEMYGYDIGDNYIAGIYPERFLTNMLADYKKAYGGASVRMLEKQVGLCVYDQYIGAGVMIMNLAQMRTDHMVRKFLEAVKPNSLPKDQDILNTCCYGHISKLPVKFCIDLHELDDLDWYADNNEEELRCIQRALGKPVVIHYSDRFKPWVRYGLRYEKIWWNYAFSLGFGGLMWDELMKNLGVENQSPTIVTVNNGMTYQEAYKEFSKGISYRIGRAITYIPRKIYYFFKSH